MQNTVPVVLVGVSRVISASTIPLLHLPDLDAPHSPQTMTAFVSNPSSADTPPIPLTSTLTSGSHKSVVITSTPTHAPTPSRSTTLPSSSSPPSESPGDVVPASKPVGLIVGCTFAAFVLGIAVTIIVWQCRRRRWTARIAAPGRGGAGGIKLQPFCRPSTRPSTAASTAPLHQNQRGQVEWPLPPSVPPPPEWVRHQQELGNPAWTSHMGQRDSNMKKLRNSLRRLRPS